MEYLKFVIGFQIISSCITFLLCDQESGESFPGMHKPIHKLSMPSAGDGMDVRFSPNGEMLACYSTRLQSGFMTASVAKSHLRVISVQSGTQQLSIPEGWRGFAFSPNNKIFLTWDEKTVSCWTFAKSDLIATIDLSNVEKVSFVRGGQWFVTFRKDSAKTYSEVKFWDAETLKHIPTPE